MQAIMPEKEQRLGAVRAGLSTGAANVFPNFSLLLPSHTIRVWHPRGPDKTEVWSWCIVDKAAPPEVKDAFRRSYIEQFGPSGMFEQDDGDNWEQATLSGHGWGTRRFPFNYQMGYGHERYREDLPGRIGPRSSESNMRGFYGRWLQLMQAKSWADVPNHVNAWSKV
jgi:3-phenylpropionate/trans-cinnamate dioxygenase alpha subunit